MIAPLPTSQAPKVVFPKFPSIAQVRLLIEDGILAVRWNQASSKVAESERGGVGLVG